MSSKSSESGGGRREIKEGKGSGGAVAREKMVRVWVVKGLGGWVNKRQ